MQFVLETTTVLPKHLSQTITVIVSNVFSMGMRDSSLKCIFNIFCLSQPTVYNNWNISFFALFDHYHVTI